MATPDAKVRRDMLARRIIYLLVAAAVVAPLLWPFELGGKPSSLARAVYERMEALPPGERVLLCFDYDPSSKAELNPMGTALVRHCFRRGLRPIVMTHWPGGVGLAQEILETEAERTGKKSGADFVLLGFRPGGADLVLNMGENLKNAFKTDYYGKPTEGMPALEGIQSLKKIPFVIDLAAGATVEMWIAYGRDRFGFDLAAGCTAVIAPDLYPFLQSKQLIGVLGGLRGAADYERLIHAPAVATAGMTAQSVVHILIIVLILAANVWFFIARARRSERT